MSADVLSRAIILKSPGNICRPVSINEDSGSMSLTYSSLKLFSNAKVSVNLVNCIVSAPRWATAAEKVTVMDSTLVKQAFPNVSIMADHCFTVNAEGRDYVVFSAPDSALIPLYCKLAKLSLSIEQIKEMERRLDIKIGGLNENTAMNPMHLELIKNVNAHRAYDMRLKSLLLAIVLSAVFGLAYGTTDSSAVYALYLVFSGAFIKTAVDNKNKLEDIINTPVSKM